MCGIEDQIANHCNEELDICYYCDLVKEGEYTQVKTKYDGFQWVCSDCVKEFDNE